MSLPPRVTQESTRLVVLTIVMAIALSASLALAGLLVLRADAAESAAVRLAPRDVLDLTLQLPENWDERPVGGSGLRLEEPGERGRAIVVVDVRFARPTAPREAREQVYQQIQTPRRVAEARIVADGLSGLRWYGVDAGRSAVQHAAMLTADEQHYRLIVLNAPLRRAGRSSTQAEVLMDAVLTSIQWREADALGRDAGDDA